MRTQSMLIAAALLGLAGAAQAADPVKAPEAAKAPTMAFTMAADVKWTPMDPKNEKSPKTSVVQGDPSKGPSVILLKVPAGGEAPIHAHTADYWAVVVKGTPAHGKTKADAKTMEPGSWWFQPGKEMHYDGCPGANECVLAIHLGGAFDFHPETPMPAIAPAKGK